MALKLMTAFHKVLAATAVGVTVLQLKVKFGLRATATGIAADTKKTFKILKATGEGVAGLLLIVATFITLASVAIGLILQSSDFMSVQILSLACFRKRRLFLKYGQSSHNTHLQHRRGRPQEQHRVIER